MMEAEYASGDLTKREYGEIAQDYAESKKHGWRVNVEEHSLKSLLDFHFSSAPASSLKILELACGSGHYTRKIMEEWKLGSSICGVDISPEMVDLAIQSSPQDGNYKFLVGDASTGQEFDGAPFDLCFAAYLLNYSSSREQLLAMCKTIKRNLKPGGIFITSNDGISQPSSSFPLTKRYGFEKVLHAPLSDGGEEIPDFTPLSYRIFRNPNNPDGGDGYFEFTNYRISFETLQWAFKEAGFSSFEKVPLKCPSSLGGVFGDFILWEPVCTLVAIA